MNFERKTVRDYPWSICLMNIEASSKVHRFFALFNLERVLFSFHMHDDINGSTLVFLPVCIFFLLLLLMECNSLRLIINVDVDVVRRGIELILFLMLF